MMKRSWNQSVVETDDEDTFYKCFDAATKPDPDPVTTYEKWYGPLESKIADTLRLAGVPDTAFYLFSPWVPNCTRHVTVERRHVSPTLVNQIHDLLRGDYRYWRIEVIIVGTIDADDRVGGIGIWPDWVLCWGIGKELVVPADAICG